MNALNMARTAYTNTAAPIRTARGTEYAAFARISAQLKQTSQNKKLEFPKFVTALNHNRRLWTLLASDVADSDNALPKELRAQIFYLAEFVIHHTAKVLAGKADEEALLDVNRSIMRGLQGEGAQL
ncbi:flagellar biosynthesis regulator FlaF [Celeribacter marinus]|uniref:flagellar biosynthesis regulator FlaF n=1 Tax=Celeribacter marinus TaxID=1397108 RepID=UPI003F6CEFA2